MDFSEKGYSLETQVALLATSYKSLSESVESMESKLDAVIEESNRKKGAYTVWERLITAALAVISGGGISFLISKSH